MHPAELVQKVLQNLAFRSATMQFGFWSFDFLGICFADIFRHSKLIDPSIFETLQPIDNLKLLWCGIKNFRCYVFLCAFFNLGQFSSDLLWVAESKLSSQF